MNEVKFVYLEKGTANNQILQYDSNTATWLSRILNLDILDDFNINQNTLTNGQVLAFDSIASKWVNSDVSGLGFLSNPMTSDLDMDNTYKIINYPNATSGSDVPNYQQLLDGLALKADATHNHDSRYYTETEIDVKLTPLVELNFTPSVDGEIMVWNQTAGGYWEVGTQSGGGLTSVNVDGTTIQGDGNGTPLSVIPGSVGLTSVNVDGTTIQGDGNGTPLSVISGLYAPLSHVTAADQHQVYNLINVNATANPTVDGQVLKWNITGGYWEYATLSGSSINLYELLDVNETAEPLAANKIIEWNGTSWVYIDTPTGSGVSTLGGLTDVELDVTSTATTGDVLRFDATGNSTWTHSTLQIDDLSNVSILAPPSDGEVLTWNGTSAKWESAAIPSGGATALNGLTDVFSVTTPITNKVLKYTGSGWYDGFVNLGELGDVTITTPRADGDYIAYNIGTGAWEARALPGGISPSMQSLTDTDFTGWVGDITDDLKIMVYAESTATWSPEKVSLYWLQEFNSANTPADGQYMKWNQTAGEWQFVDPYSDIANYADDTAADADTNLASGALYTTTAGGRAVFRKP